MYSVTPWLVRSGFEDSPTTAIVLSFLRSSRIASAPGCPKAFGPSGSSTLMAWPPVFPLPRLLPLFLFSPEASLSSRGEFSFASAFQNHLRHGRQALVFFFCRPHRNAIRLRKDHPSQ